MDQTKLVMLLLLYKCLNVAYKPVILRKLWDIKTLGLAMALAAGKQAKKASRQARGYLRD
jgi:hypothetical protein